MTTEPRFLRRFDDLWAALRRCQVRQGIAGTLLLVAAGFALLAWADFRMELPRTPRAVGLGLLGLAALAALWRGVFEPLRWWTRPRTAVEIEGRFPQLGQRIRTVVQYAGLDDRSVANAGVAPGLVGALQEETERQVEPLPLGSLVPWRRAVVLATLAAVPVLFLGVAALRNPDWRVAVGRAALIERPYTRLVVVPGSMLVDQGGDVTVTAEVKGRMRPKVLLETRPVSKRDAKWTAVPLASPKDAPASQRRGTLAKVQEPLLYRVVAGPAASKPYLIRVRYPLAIRSFEVTLTPPKYTALDPSTVKGGDVQAVEGTAARFRIAFDEAPDLAVLEMTDPASKRAAKGAPVPAPVNVPLRREGKLFVADMGLSKDLDYKIIARTVDGRKLPKNAYRIDVREDRAPRVVFDEPDEALEVHPIAEIKGRVRLGDDYGLARAGIVFRFNDGHEKTLILKDFAPPAGKKPTLSASMEETLLLETLAASPQDSVTYYAFAEDNYPGTPRRSETDLRYIDIRPFKRDYKLDDPGSGAGEPEEFTTLEELIARQRFNLNRANRLARHRPGSGVDPEDPLKIAGFEETLVTLAREFTEGIEQRAGEEVESLHSAEAAMRAAVDALDRGRNTEAAPAMAEALKHLVASRRELLNLIPPDAAAAAAMRAFDRRQAQKIRKPKGKDEEAEQVAEELEQLADDEDFAYATIASLKEAPGENKSPGGSPTGSSESKPSEPKEPAKAKDAEPEDQTAKKDGEKRESPKKAQGEEGQDGEGKKGESPKGEGEGKKREEPKGQGKMSEGQKGQGPKTKAQNGTGGEDEEGDDGEGTPKAKARREVAEKQQGIADDARDLEERLKRIEAASDLAKARMAKASEKAEKASGALSRGNSREAAEEAKAGAGMLHELARQVRGEISRETTDELAMARDLAEELAERESEMGEMKEGSSGSQGQGDSPGKGDGENPGKGEGKKPGKGEGKGPGQGRGSVGGFGGWEALNEEERLERLAEAARTLEEWLKQIESRGEGKAADAVRDILKQGTVAEIVERTARMGEVRVGSKPPAEEIGREARELAGKLDRLGRSLEMLHRGIVAPQLAAMVEFDRRVAQLTAKLGALKTDAEITAWHREAAALIRDLDKAGVAGAAELADALREGGMGGAAGGWHWGTTNDHRVAPGTYNGALASISATLKDQIQEMILKDLASARDESAPPAFRELIERYYEVLSKGGGK